MLSRPELLAQLQSPIPFDFLIIGGGATGTGIALDAITRGFRVALVEKNDFASGTSSKSTKLVHGGVRYLELAVKNLDRGQLSLVYDALQEREIFLKVAPHLARPLEIFTPLYQFWEKPYYRLGLKMYDWLAGQTSIGKSRSMTAKKALKKFPKLKSKNLKGGICYYDGQFDDARVNITLVKSALSRGAVLLNYMSVAGLTHEHSRLTGAKLLDELTGQSFNVKATCIINATGPFVDSIRLMDNPKEDPILSVSSGSHVVLKQKLCPDNLGFLIPKTDDGRVLFVLPWNNHTLAGTTDQPASVEFSPKASQDDINYILEHLAQYFETPFTQEDILSTWSGLRPLVSVEATQSALGTASLSRDHVILHSPSGLITITGGKWTTYRKMAEDTVDSAMKAFKLKALPCLTKEILLAGATSYHPNLDAELIQKYGLDKDIAQHLALAYGSLAFDVLSMTGAHPHKRLHANHPYIEAEVAYAIEFECAQKLSDVLCRRTRLAFLDREASKQVAHHVATLMQKALNWDDARRLAEEKAYADIF